MATKAEPGAARPAAGGANRPINYADRLEAAIRRRRTPAVVGIDPVLERLPPSLRPAEMRLTTALQAIVDFSRGAIDAVAPHVAAVKINSAFFEAFYAAGVSEYFNLVRHAHARGLLVIGDIKRGDIGSTAALYARGHLAAPLLDDVDPLMIPDAVTISGYLGENCAWPFIEAAVQDGKGVYMLVRPSDPGADEVHDFGGTPRFYEHMAALVTRWGMADGCIGEHGLSCVGAVVAPKDRASTAALRDAMPATPFLVPGYGAQGAGAESCKACFLPGGRGAVVNASRSVLYAYDDPRSSTFGMTDWERAIETACREFVRDLAQAVPIA